MKGSWKKRLFLKTEKIESKKIQSYFLGEFRLTSFFFEYCINFILRIIYIFTQHSIDLIIDSMLTNYMISRSSKPGHHDNCELEKAKLEIWQFSIICPSSQSADSFRYVLLSNEPSITLVDLINTSIDSYVSGYFILKGNL